jgi:membrane protease YdiL (CAAX protease family)
VRGPTSGMPYSLAICAVILSYIWIFEPTSRGGVRVAPVVIVVALAVVKASRTGEWGFRGDALLVGLVKTMAVTAILVAITLAAGEALGTLHPRRAVGRSLAFLTLWGGGQQFVLQTVVLREARELMPRAAAIIVSAGLFSAIHLPNPFLAGVTFVAALVWCSIYSRHPNIIPLAMSHALGTEAVLHAFDNEVTGHLRIGAAFLELRQPGS